MTKISVQKPNVAPSLSFKLSQFPLDRIGQCVTSVVTTAIVIPTMPKRLPVRLVAGLDRPRNARMKNTPATR